MPNSESQAWPFYYLDPLFRSIRGHAARAGYDVLMADVERDSPSHSGLIRLVSQQKVDGLVAISTKLDPEERKVLIARQFPVAMVHAVHEALEFEPLKEFSCFFTDNLLGGKLAGEHLVNCGCTKVLCLANSIETPEMHDRRIGFTRTVEKLGHDCTVLYSDSSFYKVLSFVDANISEIRRFDGVFCLTDIMACAFIQSLQRQGVAVPQNIRVIGYDDIELGTYWNPKLTTIRQPGREMVANACANLVEWIEHPAQNCIVHRAFLPELVVRESA
jgi:LacI family transcriptional regulator